nr:MAG TPA: Protein of unknown function (DUF3164) [Caudoviricetes sp.]
MNEINLSQLSAEQRREMLAQLKAQEEAEKRQREADISTYKALVSQTVEDNFPILQAVSSELAAQKRSIRNAFATVVDLKSSLYGVKDGQRSHQFINSEGTRRITIGFNVIDNYDDTVDAGIAKVKEYISSLARDEQSKILVETVLKLLSKDSKGTLKASRVLQLQQMAEKSGNADFIEGVRIIRDAYRPIESKSYVRAEYKSDSGAWVSVPLGMTEAD